MILTSPLRNDEWTSLCMACAEMGRIPDEYLEVFNKEYLRRHVDNDDLVQRWNEEYKRLKKARKEK